MNYFECIPKEVLELMISYVGKIWKYPLSFVSKLFNEFIHFRKRQSIKKFAHECMKTNNLNVLKWATNDSVELITKYLRKAFTYGSIDILEWMRYQETKSYINDYDTYVLFGFALKGGIKAAKWYFKYYPIKEEWNTKIMNWNIPNCNQETFDWLLNDIGYDLEITIELLIRAIEKNNIMLVNWIISNSVDILLKILENTDKVKIFTTALVSKNSNIEMLELLKNNGLLMCDENTLLDGIASHKLELLKWLFENNCIGSSTTIKEKEFNYDNTRYAELYDIMLYLNTKKYYFDLDFVQKIFIDAIANHQSNVYWNCLDKGAIFTNEVTDTASKSGCFEIMKMSIEKGYFGKASVTANIIKNEGSFVLLDWAYEKGCSINMLTLAEISNKRIVDFSLFKWCAERIRKKEVSDVAYFIMRSKSPNKEHIFRWFFLNKFPLGNKVCIPFLECGNLEMVRWCINNGAKLDDLSVKTLFSVSAIVDFAEYTNLLKYLRDRSFNFNKSQNFYCLIISNNYAMIKWLLDNMPYLKESIYEAIIDKMQINMIHKQKLYYVLNNGFFIKSTNNLVKIILVMGTEILDFFERNKQKSFLFNMKYEIYEKICDFGDKNIIEWFMIRGKNIRQIIKEKNNYYSINLLLLERHRVNHNKLQEMRADMINDMIKDYNRICCIISDTLSLVPEDPSPPPPKPRKNFEKKNIKQQKMNFKINKHQKNYPKQKFQKFYR